MDAFLYQMAHGEGVLMREARMKEDEGKVMSVGSALSRAAWYDIRRLSG